MTTDFEAVTLTDVVAKARDVQGTGDFAAALSAWEAVRWAFPDSPMGYAGCGAALSNLHRATEAGAVLAEAAARFPHDETIAVEHAWLAHHASDWPEADRRWTGVRARFPQAFGGYFGGGATLRVLGRYDEADALYRAALQRWPNAANLMADYAAVAQARGQQDEAQRRWAALRARHPGESDSYVREAQDWRAAGQPDRAQAVLEDALLRFAGDAKLLVLSAQIAQQRGLSALALKRWDAVISADPGLVEGYLGAAQCLNDVGRFADAQAVLQPALRRFPHSAELAVMNAWIAHYLADFSGAVALWLDVRSRFPDQAVGYTGAVTSLLPMGRSAEAAALIGQAVARFPDDMHVAMDFARVPQHSQDWEEAARRWAAVFQRFPGIAAVRSGYAEMLSKAGRLDEAEALLEAAVAQPDAEFEALKSYAEAASRRRDWPVAESRWRMVAERCPDRASSWYGLAETLSSAGRLDDSSAILAAAVPRFPESIDLERQYAQTATLRRDWPAALRLWDGLKRKYPRNQDVLGGIKQALWQAQQDLGVAASEGGTAPFTIPSNLLELDDGTSDSAAVRELLLRFESIGDTCEFGIVQRRFGAEPISLLRWASTPPEHLVAALDTRFAGVGERDHTKIAVIHGEYTTHDKRYHMFSHTFTPESAEPLEQFTRQHLRRTQYLRRKLLDDLAEGDKIFVYKCLQGLSDEQARSIHQAILRYGGRQALLCVRLEDAAHPRGTLDVLDDGLFMGTIDRFSTVDINVDIWVELCRKADASWRAALADGRENLLQQAVASIGPPRTARILPRCDRVEATETDR